MRIAMALAIALATLSAPAVAQVERPDSEAGRYIIRETEGGFLRVDRETGATSVCRQDDAGWACRAVPDDRQALEEEIVRLAEENSELARRVGELEDRLAALGEAPADPENPAAGEGAGAPGAGEEGTAEGEEGTVEGEEDFTLDLPSDAEIDQLMDSFERMVRRFLGMVRSLREDPQGEPM